MNKENLEKAEQAVREQLTFEGYEEYAGKITKVVASKNTKHDGNVEYVIQIEAVEKDASILVLPNPNLQCGWEVLSGAVGVFWNAPADEWLLESLGITSK